MDILLNPNGLRTDLFVRRLTETHYHVDNIAVERALSGGFFNVIHLHYLIKVDFYVPTERILLTMLAEHVYLPFDNMRRAAYVTPSSLIIAKLQAFDDSESTRHLDDIASIVRVQGAALDAAQIDVAAARIGVLGAWRALWSAHRPN
jgi:hypothetical protein